MSYEEFVKLPGLVSRYSEINAVQFQLRMSNGTVQLYRTRDLLQGVSANNEIIPSQPTPLNDQTVKEEAIMICTLLNPDPTVMELCIPEMIESLGLLLQHQHEDLQQRMEISRW